MDSIRQLFSLVFAVSLMYMFLGCDFSNKKRLYLVGLFEAFVIIGDIFILLHFGYSTFMTLYPLIVHIPVVIAFVLLSKYKVIKVLFVHFTIVAIVTSITMIGIIILSFLSDNKSLVNIICYILYLPSIFLINKYLRPSFVYILSNRDKGWLGFCVIPVSYTLLIYMMSTFNVYDYLFSPKVVLKAILLLSMTISAYVLIFRFFKQTREQLTLQNEQDLLKAQIAAAHTHLEALQESQEKTILYRHDMRHHLNLISTFLADNNMSATQKYIAEVEKAIDDTVVEKYCSNYAVNLILSSYITKAKQEEIAVETKINLTEKNTISDMDLCVIFSNILENAINACTSIPNRKDRSLNILCANKNEKLYIQITNSFEGTVLFANDLPISTEENHGFGTKSIAAVAQKYKGIYSFSTLNKVFRSEIII